MGMVVVQAMVVLVLVLLRLVVLLVELRWLVA